MPQKRPPRHAPRLNSAPHARYQPEEDQFIHEQYRKTGAAGVALQLNRSKLAVQWRAIAIGAARAERGAPADTAQHELIIQLRLAGMTIHGTAVVAKCSDSTVKKVWAEYRSRQGLQG